MLTTPCRLVRSALVAVCLGAGAQVSLAQPTHMTPGEVALTHPVCEDAQGMPSGWVQHFRQSPRAPYWEGLLGKTFWAVHHYCWALIHLQRAAHPALAKQHREHMIRTAIRDFYYVISEARRNGDESFPLMPELFYRAGEAYVQLGEYGQAIAEYEHARRAKPDYWPAYVGQANLHLKLGMRSQARELLEDGLQLMPDEPNLREALARVGGAPPRAAAQAAAPAASAPR